MESTIRAAQPSRLITTTALGVVFGVICMLLSRYISEVDFWPIGVALLLHHAAMGFAIGASSLKMHWAFHGALWGGIFGLFLAIGFIGAGLLEPWVAFVLPVVWGFLIETLATKAFKQPQHR